MTMKGYPMTETNNLGFIENLAAQIDYSDGSTVSKTVMRAEGVNIVLFSFAAGEELSEHTAAMPVIVEALEGQLEITAEGRTVTLNPGGIVHFTTRPCTRLHRDHVRVLPSGCMGPAPYVSPPPCATDCT